MSVSRAVYVHRAKMLEPRAWADAIRAAGFEMAMDSEFSVDEFSGFLPCTLRGHEAGFEYAYEPVEDADTSKIGDRDVRVSFVTGGDMRGLATAVIAAAVLCERCDGVLHDEEADEFVEAKDAMADARALLAEIEDDIR